MRGEDGQGQEEGPRPHCLPCPAPCPSFPSQLHAGQATVVHGAPSAWRSAALWISATCAVWLPPCRRPRRPSLPSLHRDP